MLACVQCVHKYIHMYVQCVHKYIRMYVQCVHKYICTYSVCICAYGVYVCTCVCVCVCTYVQYKTLLIEMVFRSKSTCMQVAYYANVCTLCNLRHFIIVNDIIINCANLIRLSTC